MKKLLPGVFIVSLLFVAPVVLFDLLPTQLVLAASLSRPLFTTHLVTSSADSGPGTLRQALLDATDGDTITFNASTFPLNTPATISLVTALPNITTNNLTIDGSSAGVILDGSGAPGGTNGLVIDGASNVTIKGLQIVNFPDSGIQIINGASNNQIGGEMLANRNLLSGNENGVAIGNSGTMSNTVIGNYIGTDINGAAALGNHQFGVFIGGGATYNKIERNLISGNDNIGVAIAGSGAENNVLTGNYIGTDYSGTTAVPNQQAGVSIWQEAQYTKIGGTTSSDRNLISGNGASGISLSDHNTVTGNYIGTDITGAVALPNAGGVEMSGAYNVVGGNSAGERNIISGNTGSGIFIRTSNAHHNTVSGNYIGTTVSGNAALPNITGISVADANNNTIGGNNITSGSGVCSGGCNLVSGNSGGGIFITGVDGQYNTVAGNYIGTNVSGTAVVSNTDTGISISQGANNNTIGGDTPGERNLISGNDRGAISIGGDNTDNNKVKGNYIGVDVSGTTILGNVGTGVSIWGDAEFTTVGGSVPGEGNLISGQTHSGVDIGGAAYSTIIGNLIGTDASGTMALPNGFAGVGMQSGAHHNTVGGSTPAERNIISGNARDGVWIQDSGTSNNNIIGNYIGTDIGGLTPLGNSGEGILIGTGASQNTIGISNTIAFNDRFGVIMLDSGTVENRITRNSIHHNNWAGIGLAGGANKVLPSPAINDFDRAGGTATGWVDIVACGSPCTIEFFSDDEDEGRHFEGFTTATTNNWSFSKGSSFAGPNLTATATDPSGNTSGFSIPIGAGCSVTTTANSGSGSLRACLQSAAVGTTITFNPSIFPIASPATIAVIDEPLPAILHDQVFIDASNTGVILDGSSLTSGNGLVIDGASEVEIKGLQILNFPAHGILLRNGASNNVIGGTNPTPDSTCAGDCNLLSNNGDTGVYMLGADVTNNVVSGNFIGTDISGTLDWGNAEGGVVIDEGSFNLIGGITTTQRNLISGNDGNGVGIKSTGAASNTVSGNFIGTDATGTAILGNSRDGVVIRVGAIHNVIGGHTPGERNLISGNEENGVHVDGPGTIYNTIQQNSVFSNTQLGIELTNGGNASLFSPILTHVYTNTVKGLAPAGSTVEIFSDDGDEGRYYHGQTTADSSGHFTFIQTQVFTAPFVTGTATDSAGNTSEFSSPAAPLRDAMVLAILQPKQRGKQGRAVTPTIKIANAGTTAETNITLSVSATGPALSGDYLPLAKTNLTLPTLGYATFTFPPLTPINTGSYTLRATVDMAGDELPDNNSKAITVTVDATVVDLWVRDSEADTGDIPTSSFWQSPDIWVRNNNDGGTQHQDPIANQPNTVYMVIRNRGDAASGGNDTAKVYWHEPSLAIKCGDWAEIGAQSISTLSAMGVVTLTFTWTPTRSGHTCLHGEIVSDEDPIINPCDIPWDNNLNQRNVSILAGKVTGLAQEIEAQASGDITFEITNIKNASKLVDLIVDVSDVPDANAVQLDLGDELISRWATADGAAKSRGVNWQGTSRIMVTDPVSGTIAGIPMVAGETQNITLLVNAPSVTTTTVTIYEAIDAGPGVSLDDAIVGGNSYVFVGDEVENIFLPIIFKP